MTADHDFRSWPRRSAAAKRLGVSIQALLRYEGKLVTPIRDAEGHRRYDPQELAELGAKLARGRRPSHRPNPRAPTADSHPASTPAPPLEPRVSGTLTKRAFEMFERGDSRACVAIELGEPVENVNWLHENWLAMSGRKAAQIPSAGMAASVSRSSHRQSKREPELRMVSEAEVRARAPELRSDMDREMLRWMDQLDEEKRRNGAGAESREPRESVGRATD
jgi:hypothetical protein